MSPVRLFVRLPYRDHAACVGEPPEVFFPERGDWQAVEAALSVCARCPVREECLEDNLNETDGIVGGTSAKERRRLRKERAKAHGYNRVQDMPYSLRGVVTPIPHGTAAGAKAHRRRGEELCRRCREAENVRRLERAERAS